MSQPALRAVFRIEADIEAPGKISYDVFVVGYEAAGVGL